jgi:geranylgeranylglycerol-phosphate geranylgeranyltransferase
MMNKIKAVLKLMRIDLAFSAGICVIMGQVFALDHFARWTIMLFGFFAVFLISSAILVLNDIIDLETDRINAPDRPIPSGMVKKSEALLLFWVMMGVGLYLSYTLNTFAFVISVILAIVGFLYNRFFKKCGLAGNLMVSFSVGMTFIFGSVSTGQLLNKTAIFFGLIAALIDLGEEIMADAMDMKGDELINSQSLAIKYGKIQAVKTSYIIFSIVILLSFVPFSLGWFKMIYLIPILIMDISIVIPLIRIRKSEDILIRQYIRHIYLGATLSLLIFLIMRFAGI